VDVLTTSVYGDLLVRGVVPLWFGCIVSQDMSDNAAIGAIIDSSADSCSSRIVLQKKRHSVYYNDSGIRSKHLRSTQHKTSFVGGIASCAAISSADSCSSCIVLQKTDILFTIMTTSTLTSLSTVNFT